MCFSDVVVFADAWIIVKIRCMTAAKQQHERENDVHSITVPEKKTMTKYWCVFLSDTRTSDKH